MFTLKVVTYSATFLAAMLFAFWELRLKRQLTDNALPPSKMVSDFGAINLAEQIRREQVLRMLPKQAKLKYRVIVTVKLLLVALLVAEIIVLQR